MPPQPVSIPDLKNRITAALETITPDLPSRVWQELDYRLDVCHVTKGVINLLSYSFISTSIYNSVHHTCEYNQLQNRSNHFDILCVCVCVCVCIYIYIYIYIYILKPSQ